MSKVPDKAKREPKPTKSRGGVQLCIASVHGLDRRHFFPIEIAFPKMSLEEEAEVRAAVEEFVRQLGFTPRWLPSPTI